MSDVRHPTRAEVAEHVAIRKRFADACQAEAMYAVVGDPDTVVPRRLTHRCGLCGGRKSSNPCRLCLGSGRVLGTDPHVMAVPVVELVAMEAASVGGNP